MIKKTFLILNSFLILSGFFFFNSCDNEKPKSELAILLPYDGTIFPPEMAAPIFLWEDTINKENKWVITIKTKNTVVFDSIEVSGKEWRPTEQEWGVISALGKENEIIFSIERATAEKKVRNNIKFTISNDLVDASIFFRSVPLPFKFARENLKKVKWHVGNVRSPYKPHAILENIPVCANCHSFTRDGKTIAMDVDAIDDKGAYAISTFEEKTKFDTDSIITWSKFQEGKFTYGLLSQISPNGRYVVSTLKDCEIFVDRKDLEYSQLFFPFKGILVIYDRQEKRFFELPGANDTSYVHSNPTWTPDGKNILFTKAIAKHYDESGILNGSVPSKDGRDRYKKFEKKFLDRDSLFKFDIYTIPFNDGKGGQAAPVKGASNNGLSNYFPKVSPDGKWLVFCQAESFMLLQKDSKLMIIPISGGEPREMNCNTDNMNSWHSWSPNGKWMVFATKALGPYTQLFLTHIDENGNDSPPVYLDRFSFKSHANNIPEFVNAKYNPNQRIEPNFLSEDDFLVRMGEILQQSGDFEKAIESFTKVIERFPNNAEAYFNRSKINYYNYQLDEAFSDINKAISLNPNNTFYYSGRGLLFMKKKDYESAFKDLNKAYEIDSIKYEVNSYLGVLYAQTGDVEKGIKYLKKAIELNDKDHYSYQFLGKIYYNKNWLSDAKNAYTKSIEGCKDQLMLSQSYNLRALVSAKQGLFNEALIDIDKAISIYPDHPGFLCQKGKIMLSAGQNQGAISCLQEAKDLGSEEAGEILKMVLNQN